MSATPVFRGKVNAQGNLELERQVDFWKYLCRFKEKRVEVVVRRVKSQRSLDQNAYWWAVTVEIMADYMGEERTAAHYALLGECFGYHYNEKLRRHVPNKGSSSRLTTEEFSQLIEWCPPWALENHSVNIPLPNEVEVMST